MQTCFMILIQDNAVFYDIMYLDGWNHIAALVFWFLYIILMVFILFNFLIAIIVDAFMDIKVGELGSTEHDYFQTMPCGQWISGIHQLMDFHSSNALLLSRCQAASSPLPTPPSPPPPLLLLLLLLLPPLTPLTPLLPSGLCWRSDHHLPGHGGHLEVRQVEAHWILPLGP